MSAALVHRGPDSSGTFVEGQEVALHEAADPAPHGGVVPSGDADERTRITGFEEVVCDGRVGLLFLLPGLDETLRVNGRATLTTSDVVLDA